MKLLSNGFPEFDTGFKETMDFYSYVFEQELERAENELTEKSGRYPALAKAMSYSLSAGGKRIRPVLTMEMCRAAGGNLSDCLPAAIAIEMIHTFSLIHDDLPCMDDDDLRRGKPSCHIAFGEANALLAGDALTVEACRMISDSEIAADKAVKMISALCSCSYGMIGGQIIDVDGRIDSIEQLYSMYELKTSQLLIAAAKMGCIAAGADDAVISSAEKYAYNTGIAFQLIDDILDVTADEATLGKPVGSDVQQNKTTSVTLIGIDRTSEEAKKFTGEAVKALSAFKENRFLLQLTDMLLNRKK